MTFFYSNHLKFNLFIKDIQVIILIVVLLYILFFNFDQL